MRALNWGMFTTCGARAPSNQPARLGRCASSLRRWPRVAHQPKQPSSSKVRGSIFSLLLVWFSGDMKSERPSKDDEQHCRCVVWEEKTVLQSLYVAFSAPSRRSSFLRILLFMRRRTSTGFASRRFSRWQSENKKDSRLGRVRIIISDGTCALLNAQQIKKKWWVVRHAFVPCVRGQAKDCMCACVLTFVTCWDVVRAVDQTPAVALHFFNFFVRCL